MSGIGLFLCPSEAFGEGGFPSINNSCRPFAIEMILIFFVMNAIRIVIITFLLTNFLALKIAEIFQIFILITKTLKDVTNAIFNVKHVMDQHLIIVLLALIHNFF